MKNRHIPFTIGLLTGILGFLFYLAFAHAQVQPDFPDNDCLAVGQIDTDHSSDDVVCITPTPTEAITPTPQPSSVSPQNGSSPQPQGNQSTTNPPPAIVCTIAFSPPFLTQFDIVDSNSVQFTWLESDANIDKYSIIYGYSPQTLIYGQDTISPASVKLDSVQNTLVVHHLDLSQHVFAQIYAWKNGCSETSNIIDP